MLALHTCQRLEYTASSFSARPPPPKGDSDRRRMGGGDVVGSQRTGGSSIWEMCNAKHLFYGNRSFLPAVSLFGCALADRSLGRNPSRLPGRRMDFRRLVPLQIRGRRSGSKIFAGAGSGLPASSVFHTVEAVYNPARLFIIKSDSREGFTRPCPLFSVFRGNCVRPSFWKVPHSGWSDSPGSFPKRSA